MRHYGLIGERLGHSLSVPIHEAIFRYLGIDADYRLIELSRDGLAEGVRGLLTELDGFNVTIPYKEAVIPLLRALSPEAEAIGAVNTVDAKSGVGYNTDAGGFAAMLRHHGMDPAGQPAYVLGTGGAAKAARAALHAMGARPVMVSRHPGAEAIGYDELSARLHAGGGYLINATPVGMWPQVDGCPVDEAILPNASGVADMIFNPRETRLTQAAKAAGVPACTGLYMLVAQAVAAEEIWQGRSLPEDLTDDVMKELDKP